MKKKLAVLGCGIAAVPILKKAREMEVETYCFALEELLCAKGLSNFFLPISFLERLSARLCSNFLSLLGKVNLSSGFITLQQSQTFSSKHKERRKNKLEQKN